MNNFRNIPFQLIYYVKIYEVDITIIPVSDILGVFVLLVSFVHSQFSQGLLMTKICFLLVLQSHLVLLQVADTLVLL